MLRETVLDFIPLKGRIAVETEEFLAYLCICKSRYMYKYFCVNVCVCMCKRMNATKLTHVPIFPLVYDGMLYYFFEKE